MKYNVSGITHIGKTRKSNQDNFYYDGLIRKIEDPEYAFDGTFTDEKPCLVAVFDGMGGESDGDEASLIAAETTRKMAGEDPEAIIYEINEKICREMDAGNKRMGSTCVYLEIRDGKCRSFNLGDSRSYVFHDEELTQLSEDHTEAAAMAAFIEGDLALLLACRNSLTQHLGIPGSEFIIEPFVSDQMELYAGDMLLICSDGLTHMLEDDEIAGVLKGDATLHDKTARLADAALDRGGLDNITLILIEPVSA